MLQKKIISHKPAFLKVIRAVLSLSAAAITPLSFSSCDLLQGIDPTTPQNHVNEQVSVEIIGVTCGTTDLSISWIARSQEVSRVVVSLWRTDTDALVFSPVSIAANNNYLNVYAGDMVEGTSLGIDLEVVIAVYGRDDQLTDTVRKTTDTLGRPIRFDAPQIDFPSGLFVPDYTDSVGNQAYLQPMLNTKNIPLITNTSSGGFVEARFELFKLGLDGALQAPRLASFIAIGDLPATFTFTNLVFEAPLTGVMDLDPETTYVLRVRGYVNTTDDLFVERTILLPLFVPNKLWLRAGLNAGPGNKVQAYNDFYTACAEAMQRLGAPLNQASVTLYLQAGDSLDLTQPVILGPAVTVYPGYDVATETRTGTTLLQIEQLGKLIFENGAQVQAGLQIMADTLEPALKLSGPGSYDFVSLEARSQRNYLYDVDGGSLFGFSSFGKVVFEMDGITTVNFSGQSITSGSTSIAGIIATDILGLGRINFLEDTRVVWGGIYVNGVGLDFRNNSRFVYAPQANDWAGVNNAFSIFATQCPYFITASTWQVDAVASTLTPNKRFMFLHMQNAPLVRMIDIQALAVNLGFATNAQNNCTFLGFSFLGNGNTANSLRLRNIPLTVAALPDGPIANLTMSAPLLVFANNTVINELNALHFSVLPSTALYLSKPLVYVYEGPLSNVELFTNNSFVSQTTGLWAYHDQATGTEHVDNTLINDDTQLTQNGPGSAIGNSFLP